MNPLSDLASPIDGDLRRSVPRWRFLEAPARLWWASLPLRVVASTLLGTVLTLVLGGWFLTQQATAGVLNGKRASALAETSLALDSVDRELRASSAAGAITTDALTRVAVDAVNRGSLGGQYVVVVQGPVSDILSGGVDAASVPSSLRQEATLGTDGLWITPTQLRYLDGRPPVPALAVAGNITAPGSGRYPVYLLFPLTQEMATLEILQNALLTTGLLVVLALSLTSYLIARQIVRPVRQARLAAERLASGHLEDRMPIRGTDDLARLAVSMNHMAAQLQQRIRQMEDLSLVQQRFVSDVSHELRTPLTTVRMAAEVLYDSREAFDPAAARSAELLRAEVHRFDELLADLLEISRFDAQAAVLDLEEVDLSALVRAEVAAQESFATRMGTELVVTAPEPCLAEMDPRRITRVVRNLLTNAIEHGEARPIDITVAGDESAVAVTVRDHGVGFRASETPQVFHRFWRADPSRARAVGGNGLGLAISLEDVRLHRGWLNAWGRPGQGAQFRMTLPRRESDVLTSSPLTVVPIDVSAPLAWMANAGSGEGEAR